MLAKAFQELKQAISKLTQKQKMATGRSSSVMYSWCVGALLLVGAGLLAVVQARVIEEGCPVTEYAYPFQSVCQEPAEWGVEYHLVAPFSNALVAAGGITPNSESLLTFTGVKGDEGASYVLSPVTRTAEENITLGTSFILTNSATNKSVGFSGDFLAELDSGATPFYLEVACDVPLPCPTTTGARCVSYYLRNVNLDNKLLGVELSGLTYILDSSAVSADNLPILLRRVSSSSA